MKTKILTVIIGCAFVIGLTGSFCSAKKIKLIIPSGAKIRCIYHGTSGGEKRPAVLILPGLSGLRTSWKQDYNRFANWLKRKYKFNVLVIDYRARSTEEMWKIIKEQRSISFVKEEVAAGLDYLRKQESVDKDKIGLVGFSYGTYLSIKTTAREDSVKAVALVSLIKSPTKDEERVQEFLSCASRPIFFLAAEKDYIRQNKANAADNSLYWSKLAKSDTKIEIRKDAWHSVELLRRKGIKEMIGDWLQKYLI